MSVRHLHGLLRKTSVKKSGETKAYGAKEMIANGIFEKTTATLTVILTEFDSPPSLSYKHLFWLFPITRLDVPADFVIRDKKPRPTTMRLGDIISSWMISGKGADKRVICRGIPREMKKKSKKLLRGGIRGVFPNCVEMFLTSYTNTVYCKLFDTHVKFSGIIDHYGDQPADVPLLMEKIIGFIYRAERIRTFARANPTFVQRSLALFKGELHTNEDSNEATKEQATKEQAAGGSALYGSTESVAGQAAGKRNSAVAQKTDKYAYRISTPQERDAVVAAVVRGKSEEEDGTHSSRDTANEFLDALSGICYDLHSCFSQPTHSDLADIVAQIISEPEQGNDDAESGENGAENDGEENDGVENDGVENDGWNSEDEDVLPLRRYEESEHKERKLQKQGDREGEIDRNNEKEGGGERSLAYVTKPSLLVRSFQLDQTIHRDALAHCLVQRPWMIAYYINAIHKEVNVQVPPTDETYNACLSCEETAMEVNLRVSKMGKVTVSGGCDITNKAVFERFMLELDEILGSDEYKEKARTL